MGVLLKNKMTCSLCAIAFGASSYKGAFERCGDMKNAQAEI